MADSPMPNTDAEAKRRRQMLTLHKICRQKPFQVNSPCSTPTYRLTGTVKTGAVSPLVASAIMTE